MDALARGYSVSFTVPGDVTPWARARVGKSMTHFTPKKQRDYGAVIRDNAFTAMNGRPPMDVPCELRLVAFYPFPKSWSAKKRAACAGWKATKPDLDNIVKIVKDAMNGIVYTDDARVCSSHEWKKFDDHPRLMVEVRPLV